MNLTCLIQSTAQSDPHILLSMALSDKTKTDYLTFPKYVLNWSPQYLGVSFIPQFPYTMPPLAFQIMLTLYLLNQRAFFHEAWLVFPKHMQFFFSALL